MVQTAIPEWAKRIDSILHKQGRSRSWLARKIEMNHTQFSRLMNDRPTMTGSHYRLTDEIKHRIADALEIPESLIFTDAEHRKGS